MSGRRATTERRVYSRVGVDVEAEVVPRGQPPIVGHARNVSLGGAFVPLGAPPPVGTRCHVTLYVGGRESRVRIEADGAVAWSAPDGAGFAFRNLLGPESWEHLERLVTLNHPDPAAIEPEAIHRLGLAGATPPARSVRG